jgi:hypothetical protein
LWRLRIGFACATVTALTFASLTDATPSATPPRASFPKHPCRADPLAGAYAADRLKLLSRCRAIVGTVREPFRNGDGDNSFNLKPDPAYASMLNATNRAEGGIHVEIVPADQLRCVRGQPAVVTGFDRPDLGLCTGARVRFPRAGEHVRVIGAYVLDPDNHWFEIHPAWQITRVRSG